MNPLRRSWLTAAAVAAGVIGVGCTQMLGIEELELREQDAAEAPDAALEAEASKDVSPDDASQDTGLEEADVSQEAGEDVDAKPEAEPDVIDSGDQESSVDAAEAGPDAGCAVGSKLCAGQCVPTSQPATGCGQPGCSPCVFAHGSAICDSSDDTCALSACVLGYEDCDGLSSTGCEAALKTDIANCGVCGKKCSYAHGVAQCVGGTCQFSACESDWADCDGDLANGCETQTSVDLLNCGGCGNGCSFQHAAAECVAGQCKLGACDTDYLDCDSLESTGCEVFAPTSIEHCGSCNLACSPDSGTPACKDGNCVAQSCPIGFGDCDGSNANGCEIDLTSDLANCGACGYACSFANGTATCAVGVCQIANCDKPYGNCDNNASNGCETNTLTSLEHCGACAAPCIAGPNASVSCVDGACENACQSGWGDCDGNVSNGCETDLLVSTLHCGACGRVCSTKNVESRECNAGACESTCALGASNCILPLSSADDGCETPSSDQQCGSCDNDCTKMAGGFVCGGGGKPANVCSCNANTDCNPKSGTGTCLTSGGNNGLCRCGGANCHRGEHCVFDAGENKDVCSCNGGAACPQGESCCQAGCRNLNTDPQSCGACGRVCPPGFTCLNGACGCTDAASCDAGSPGTCEGNACVCGSKTCASGKRCLPDGSCG